MSANVLLFSVVFFSFFRLALTEEGERCGVEDERKVNECLQPMLEYAAKLQADTGAMQFPLQGGDVFKKLCSIFIEFKSCVSPVTCDSLSVDAVDASYGYMCGAGQPLFEQHAACFARVEAEKSYINCKTAATQAISEAQETKLNSGSTEAYLAEMCRAMDGYLRCSHPIILDKCGSEAWRLVSTVTRDSLGVTMPDCDMRSALI
ncbi:hypothetical protein NECAME_08454 [Necator americanus]|uniref:T20D4.11-like domain-containing protein n=1 Tax=Necator americanus TaxID=51031 RepID=W2TI91_NECAM|nr:hypothetical protein NECAME_08454 [Necator americanus]ETN81543.1 hypothetical protein NECAME_08454 [Necator americanus]